MSITLNRNLYKKTLLNGFLKEISTKNKQSQLELLISFTSEITNEYLNYEQDTHRVYNIENNETFLQGSDLENVITNLIKKIKKIYA